jgi:phosphoribosylanthranilate isomerase
MIGGIRLKICGLTSLADAELALGAGADFAGFNLYPGSPRYIPLGKFAAIQGGLPKGAKVAISVAPSPSELRAFEDAGADLFQVHFPEDTALEAVRAWSEAVGPERLWLAPRLAPGMDVPAALLPLAGVFLMDAFSPDKFGGTGLTGDWGKFASHQAAHPEKGWVLSGGLGPDNIGRALAASGARWVDANSGVESAPGVKDRAKLTALAERIRDSQKK